MQFDGAAGIVPLASLWTSYFSSETQAVSQHTKLSTCKNRHLKLSFFYNDYSTAASTASSIDNKIATNSIAAGGQDYLTITSLSARQALAGTRLVGNSTKQYLFLKEISSDGNVQTVDVIFPFYPVLLYLQPSLAKIMLDPLFENQESGQYPNMYSMHDLSAHYPKATGYHDGKDEP